MKYLIDLTFLAVFHKIKLVTWHLGINLAERSEPMNAEMIILLAVAMWIIVNLPVAIRAMAGSQLKDALCPKMMLFLVFVFVFCLLVGWPCWWYEAWKERCWRMHR